MPPLNRGILYALGAYITWGTLPIFWKQLSGVSALELSAHRVLWAFVLLSAALLMRRTWLATFRNLTLRRYLFTYAATATLLAINWLTYIWAINSGQIIATSLGYFVNPLVNVVLGVLFLRESLRNGQWLAVLIAGIGVVYLTFAYGQLPWISLTLAVSFGFYGLLRKTSPIDSLAGLAMEMGILCIPTSAYLVYLYFDGQSAWQTATAPTHFLLVTTGLVTITPLLLFGAAARRIPLSALGVLQYMAPTIQFLIGIYLYGEPFSSDQLIGFLLIWLALVTYSADGMLARRHARTRPQRDPAYARRQLRKRTSKQ